MSYDYDNTGIDSFDLSQFDGNFEEAVVEEHEYDDIPDGKYQVNVEKAELTRSQTSGNPMLKWTLKILAPKFVGRLLWRNNVITNDSMKWLKTDLYTCGLKIEKLSELPARIGDLLDVKLEVSKRTRGESESIYLNRRIVIDETKAADESALAPF